MNDDTRERAELLLDALDRIRLGDAQAADLIRYDLASRLCWDGIEELRADPGYAQGDPMNPGPLRSLVEDIWCCQDILDMGPADLAEHCAAKYGRRVSWAAMQDEADDVAGEARSLAARVLAMNRAALNVAAHGLIGHYAPLAVAR